MKMSKLAAVSAALILAVSAFAGCRPIKTEKTSEAEHKTYVQTTRVIGENKIEVSINEDKSVNNSTFKVNKVINSGRKTDDGLNFIYADVTIKNDSDQPYTVNALNNFYLLLNNGVEVYTDVRTDIYGKQHVNGYEQLLEVAPGAEYTGYVGFLLGDSVKDFTLCYFPTGTDNDKTNVIQCKINESDIVDAPADFIINE